MVLESEEIHSCREQGELGPIMLCFPWMKGGISSYLCLDELRYVYFSLVRIWFYVDSQQVEIEV